ncbi:MAG: HesA/MoeB/ThiF family protein [Spirochaetota bacterium]
MDNRDVSLDEYERKRYIRQIVYPQWGENAQRAIKASTVFIAGAGGLGSSVAVYLAAAGVGCIRICDFDRVELTDLNRQILYSEGDIGKPKVRIASKTISRINPHVRTVPLLEKISKENIAELVDNASIVVDCLDNFDARLVINEHIVRQELPFVHGGVCWMTGQITFIHPPETPCLKCLFPAIPPPETFPIIGAAPGFIGCLQAMEVLKFLSGIGSILKNRLLIWEGDIGNFEEIRVEKNPHCDVCGSKGDIADPGK